MKPESEAAEVRRPTRLSWTIRPAVQEDVPRLASFGAALFRQAYEPTHPEPTLSAYLANAFAESRVAQSVADRASTTLLAEAADGSWLGYAALREGGPSEDATMLHAPLSGESPLEIVRFYVDEAWQGRGVAQALMNACDGEARARGRDVLWLQAWQQAPQALRFYAKSGFVTHGTTVFQFGERTDADFILARTVQRWTRQGPPS